MSVSDVDFLIQTLFSSVLKIIQSSSVIDEDEIYRFVSKCFESTPRCTVSILLELCVTKKTIVKFFKKLDTNFSTQISTYSIQKRYIDGTPLDPLYLTLSSKEWTPPTRNLFLTNSSSREPAPMPRIPKKTSPDSFYGQKALFSSNRFPEFLS